MSRKSVPFPAPAGASGEAAARRIAPGVIDAHSDEWVSDRNSGAKPPAGFVLDLSAERSLTEVLALSALAPFALGWFWFLNAMSGRVRF